MASVSSCPICGSLDTELYLAGEDNVLHSASFGSSRTDHSPGTINRCRVCGHAFRVVRPSSTELGALYRDMATEKYEAETAQRRTTAARHLRRVERKVNGTAPLLLDVGCGSGLLLDLAARAGWEIVGVEPSTNCFQAAQKLLAGRGQLVNTTLQEAGFAPDSFDVITAWDVIEHVNDPAAFVDLCARLLKPGGFLFMKAPDIDSVQARLFGARWPVLLPEHLHYFTQASLRRCGDRANLQLVEFGRQSVFFSLGYLFYRLSQHGIVGTGPLNRIVSRSFLSGIAVPLRLGERYVVWKKHSSAGASKEVEWQSVMKDPLGDPR